MSSMGNDTPALFQPLTLRGMTLKNRISMSPMCMYSARDGFPNDWHIVHYGARACGGIGLIIVEATGVVPEGRITGMCTGIWKDEHISHYKKIVDFAHSQGCKVGIQIGHAGRKAEHENLPMVAPSAIAFSPQSRVPKELTIPEIQDLIQKFADAALRAVKAGFDTIEIHGAHGYLVHQFYSPISNHRNDDYGGSFENRIRFLCEIVKAIRKVIPDSMPLLTRISSEDWIQGGWSLADSVKLGSILKNLGVDLVDCSAGGIYYLEKFKGWGLYMVKFAEQVKSSGIHTSAVGGITSAQVANEIIATKKADLVMMGKQLLYDPYFAHRAIVELGVEKQSADQMWPGPYVWPRKYLK